ncbi:MAG: DUF2971 domain-containing protein [bacterium]|nr:DUF2971 domain-containing protein [bacterium]
MIPLDINIKKQFVASVHELQNLPTLVYKYRDISNPFHLKLITRQEIFFSSPADFEDSLDCKLPTDYSLLTEDDILKHFIEESLSKNPYYTPLEHLQWASYWSKHSPIRDKEYVKKVNQEHMQRYFSRVGVLSVTAVPDNIDMWNKYSLNRTGFCVGFNSKMLFSITSTGGGEVQYLDEIPKLHPFENPDIEHSIQVYCKEKKWAFEKEYRCYKFWDHDIVAITERQIKVPIPTFSEVIIGDLMPQNEKIGLIELIKTILPNVVIKTIRHNDIDNSIQVIDIH